MDDLPASLSEFEARLHAALDPVALPSIAYGVTRGRETLLLGAAGIADKATQREATTSTPYSLASITKPMTATAVMMLSERGLIELDEPINRYLESYAGPATVRQVGNHTAGLPLHYQFFYVDEPYRRPPMPETIRRYAKQFWLPGEHYQYSNLGYGLLDYLIERVSGTGYASSMAEEVFGKLGMRGSTIGMPEGAAVRYAPEGWAYPDYDFDHPGGSAAFSSVEDLLRFGQFHLGLLPGPVSPAGLSEMHRPTVQVDGTRGYGFGWGTNADRLGFPTIHHTGSMGGVTTVLRLVPSLDLVIAVLSNGESPLAARAADEALAAISPEFRSRLEAESEPPATAVQPVPEKWRGQWKGEVETYAGNRAFQIDIGGPFEGMAALDDSVSPIEELQVRDGRLLGVIDGDVKTEDSSRRPYRIHLDLKCYGSELYGAAVTISTREPGQRMGNALAYLAKLTRA